MFWLSTSTACEQLKNYCSMSLNEVSYKITPRQVPSQLVVQNIRQLMQVALIPPELKLQTGPHLSPEGPNFPGTNLFIPEVLRANWEVAG
ncbi:hypothetical protein SUGI_0617710 [Cryptomeria japonica]|nr:hypothetical protein SUGI_0617710 [Cryptomeria japonica]